MYYGRKKGIIIAIVVAIVAVILLAIGGFFLYKSTDLFKSNKTLFWKYATNGMESVKAVSNTQLDDVEKLKQQQPYTVSGELTLSSSNSELNNVLGKLKLDINGENDVPDNYAHTNAKLQYNNNEIFNIDYVKADDVYALKSDEIVLAYLGIRNENLKVLAQKLDIEDTTNIPDKINQINYTDLLTISEEELNNISETYKAVLMENIQEANYSKQTEAVIQKDGISYTTTSYRLDLSSQEISDILVKILNTLKTDSITLNMLATKAKALGLNEYSTVDGISKAIDDAITSVQEKHFTDTSFVVYNYEGKTIATEILVKNEEKITIFNDENTIKITIENLTNSADYDVATIDVSYRMTSTASSMLIKVSQDGEEKASINLTNTGSAAQGNLQTDITAMLAIQDETVELNYTQTLEFVDEIENMIELNETNCAILNDYSQEQLNGLLSAVMNQIEVVINQKMQVLGLVSSEEEQVETENVQQSEQMQQI